MHCVHAEAQKEVEQSVSALLLMKMHVTLLYLSKDNCLWGSKKKMYFIWKSLLWVNSLSRLRKISLKYENLQLSHLIYLCASGLHVEVISISGVLPHPVAMEIAPSIFRDLAVYHMCILERKAV